MRRVRPSHPASACSFSTLRLNVVLTHGIPPDSRGGVHFYLYRHTPSDRSRVYQVMQLRIDGVQCREPTDKGPVVLKVVPVTGAAFAGHHEPVNMHCSFPKTTIGCCCCCCCFLTLTDPLRIQPWSQDRRNQTKSNRESEMSMESIQKRTGKK